MNAITSQVPTTENSNANSMYRRFFALIGLVIGIVALVASELASAAPPAAEAYFIESTSPGDARLKSAREAKKRGDHDLAIHDYLASIQEDASTAEAAIGEMVDVLLSVAEKHNKDGRFMDESTQITRCYQSLLQLKNADGSTKTLPEPARMKLFRMIDRVRAAGSKAAKSHLASADHLRKDAKGWWDDDEGKQAEALHLVNVAWSYYPAHTDEDMVSSMYEIWAALKGELTTWQYNHVMERDRLQLGRAVGDRP